MDLRIESWINTRHIEWILSDFLFQNWFSYTRHTVSTFLRWLVLIFLSVKRKRFYSFPMGKLEY